MADRRAEFSDLLKEDRAFAPPPEFNAAAHVRDERIYADADVMPYLPGGQPRPKTDVERILNIILQRWVEHPPGVWAVVEKASAEFVGHAGLVYPENQPEPHQLIYALGKEYWEKVMLPRRPGCVCTMALRLPDLTVSTRWRFPTTRRRSG